MSATVRVKWPGNPNSSQKSAPSSAATGSVVEVAKINSDSHKESIDLLMSRLTVAGGEIYQPPPVTTDQDFRLRAENICQSAVDNTNNTDLAAILAEFIGDFLHRLAADEGKSMSAPFRMLQDSLLSTAKAPLILNLMSMELLSYACSILSYKWLEPHLVDSMPWLLDTASSSKLKSAKEWVVERILPVFLHSLTPYMASCLFPHLFAAMDKTRKSQTRVAALVALKLLADVAPAQLGASLVDIIDSIGDCMSDMKREVSDQAKDTMSAIGNVVGNRDIEAVIPQLIECIGNHEQVENCIKTLSGTTFVRDVEAPTLAIIVPTLCRALLIRSNTVISRKTSIIVNNIAKLVCNPHDVINFLPQLIPGLQRIVETAADPELRQVTHTTIDTLTSIVASAEKIESDDSIKYTLQQVEALLKRLVLGELKKMDLAAATFVPGAAVAVDEHIISINFAAKLSYALMNERDFDKNEWAPVREYLSPYFTLDLEQFRSECKQLLGHEKKFELHGQEVLCDTVFSLGYGGLLLLKKARLHLTRGERYGLVGANGVGKSTLLKAIANNQLEGFPPADQLRTVYVAHGLQGSGDRRNVVEFTTNHFPHLDLKEIVGVLDEIGFSDDLKNMGVNSLSGGWKMKLEIAMAMLKRADILLLDEPTNHLDVKNVEWLQTYLQTHPQITSLIVSHDEKFMDNVCTQIIHYEKKQLKVYHGNFNQFVTVVPEAKSYLENDEPDFAFEFPDPGYLDGIRSLDRKIIRLKNVSFTYPNTKVEILHNLDFALSLSSRINIHGKNGAGKSTMIKILTGELLPTSGEVSKNVLLRVAYVAQHAFHHLEQHMDSTPNSYIRWRFENGYDKELLSLDSRQLSEAEEKIREQKNIEYFCGRQKVKRSYKYEVKYVGRPHSENSWVLKETLEEMGFTAMMKQYDDQQAARQGNSYREITMATVEKHLSDMGLDPEFGTHNSIKSLSGGQKVKVVLAAATWLKPHVIVLDEPSNYLDIKSLKALENAIKAFKGGILLISHNQKFVDQTCTEIWDMENGRLIPRDGTANHLTESMAVAEQEASTDSIQTNDSEAAAKPAKAPRIRKKETRRERIIKEKIKLAKLKKYGPKADGSANSSDEEIETHIHI